MALTSAQAKEALKAAINGWLLEVEAQTPVVNGGGGAMFQFVAQIPAVQPKAFALAYMFVSEDEPGMIELHRRLSAYLDAGLPEFDES